MKRIVFVLVTILLSSCGQQGLLYVPDAASPRNETFLYYDSSSDSSFDSL